MPKTFSALIIVHTVRSPFSARVTKSLRIREWDSLIGLSFHEIQVLKQTLCSKKFKIQKFKKMGPF